MSRNNRTRIPAGGNLVDCWRDAEKLGCTVGPVAGTGEIRFEHPIIPESVRVDGRRKDAPRRLTCWLNKLIRALSKTASGLNRASRSPL
jgi:hypothetical protein